MGRALLGGVGGRSDQGRKGGHRLSAFPLSPLSARLSAPCPWGILSSPHGLGSSCEGGFGPGFMRGVLGDMHIKKRLTAFYKNKTPSYSGTLPFLCCLEIRII